MSAKNGKGGNVFAAKGKAIAEQEERRRNKVTVKETKTNAAEEDQEQTNTEKAEQPAAVQPEREIPKAAAGSAKGLQDGWTRFTVTTRVDIVEDLKVYAFKSRQSIKDVVTAAFEEYLSDKDIGTR